MFEQLQSILTGTAGLTLAVIVAVSLGVSRDAIARDQLGLVRWLVCVGVALHICHFAEEALTGFYIRFPELLGLASWPVSFFVSFNLAWIAVWLLCVAWVGAYPRAAIIPIWFLAIGSTANGIVHPLLALAAGGYFPGLWSSVPVGILGIVLLRALAAATRGGTTSRGAG